MMLGKLPVPGRPTILFTVGQGPTALAVGAGGVVWAFLLSFILSFLVKPKTTNQPNPDMALCQFYPFYEQKFSCLQLLRGWSGLRWS